MPNPLLQHVSSGEWRRLYRAAILEIDGHFVEKKISEVEEAILARTVEIFRQTGPDAAAEREDLDDAMYTLRALRGTAANTSASQESLIF